MKIWGRSTAKRFLPGVAEKLSSRWKTTGKSSATAAIRAMSPPTTRGDRLEIDDLYLAPAFQGKGIGTAVLRQMVAQAMQENKTPYLYVFIRNEGAVRLYRRLGFAVVQEIPNSRYIMEYRG